MEFQNETERKKLTRAEQNASNLAKDVDQKSQNLKDLQSQFEITSRKLQEKARDEKILQEKAKILSVENSELKNKNNELLEREK